MLFCYVCNAFNSNILSFKAHLRSHEISGKIMFPILCKQNNFSSYFSKLANFFRHIHQRHCQHYDAGNVHKTCDSHISVSDASGTESLGNSVVLPSISPNIDVGIGLLNSIPNTSSNIENECSCLVAM